MTRKNDEVKYLTKKDLKSLFKAIESQKWKYQFWLRDLTMFELAYYCGLRISEVGLIKLENYNASTGEIYIKRLKWSNNSTIILDKERRYILNKYLREYPIKNQESSIFLTRTGKSMDKSTLEYLVEQYKNLAKLHDFHFHMLKHSIAVHLLEIGLSIFDLKNYLWHKSINSTMIYASFTSKMNEQVYRRIVEHGLVSWNVS